MMKKMRLYKFMHIPLLKNNAQFKPKGINNKKNINHLNLLKNKNHVQKKKITSKQKKKNQKTKTKTKKHKRKQKKKKKKMKSMRTGCVGTRKPAQ